MSSSEQVKAFSSDEELICVNCRVAEQAEVNNMPASNLAIGE